MSWTKKCSAAFKQSIRLQGDAIKKFLPQVHRCNAAKQAIQTFNDHFVVIFAGIADTFPMNEWDLLLNKAKITLNLLRNANLNPKILAYAYMNGWFDYNATPLFPVSSECLIHKKESVRLSWGYRAKDRWYAGHAMEHFQCFCVMAKDTKATATSNTIKINHVYLPNSCVVSANILAHTATDMARAVCIKPTPTQPSTLQDIKNLQLALQQ